MADGDDVEVDETPVPRVAVRCRGKRVVKLIEGLNEVQREAVKTIGFGGLLDLKMTHFPLKYAMLFLKSFNDGTHIFRASDKKEFLVSKHDVHDCFLLPQGPIPVPLVPTGRLKNANVEEVKQLKEKWRKKYNITKVNDPIPLGKIYAELEADEEGGDQFRRLFVLFSMSSFLCPTSNNGVDWKLLRAVEDAASISQYDWCSYVLNSVVSAGLDSVNTPKYLLGCIPLLMVAYLHRFDFRGEALPADLPLIKHWDEEKLVDRLEAELISGSLGRLTWSSVKYPRCTQPDYVQGNFGSTLLTIMGNDSPRGKTSIEPKSSNQKNKSIQILLPPGVEDDQELEERAVDDVHELYLKMQRNAIAFHAWYADATSKLKRLTTHNIPPTEPGLSQSTQAFFEDESLHRYVDEVVALCAKMKQSNDKAPVYQEVPTTSKTSTNFQAAETGNGSKFVIDHELLCTLYSPGEIDQAVRSLYEDCNAPAGGPTEELAVDKEVATGGTEEAEGDTDPQLIYIPHTELVNHPFLLHSESPLPCMAVVPENFGCSIDCGAPDPDKVMVSDFMRRGNSLFSSVFSLRKDVMDYVFDKSENQNKRERVVRFNGWFYINREEVWSLEPGQQVFINVVDCWCLLMNHIIYKNSAPSRCFYGLSHASIILEMFKAKKIGKDYDKTTELFGAWDMWKSQNISTFNGDSDMVFVPVLSGDWDHFSCACINFISEKIEYLDNRSYGEDFNNVPYVGLARIAADEMGKYMLKNGITRGSKVSGFELVNIKFSWQKEGYSANNCGIYMMLHMLFYCGSLFECGLGRDDAMDLFRAEIAAILILSDVNTEREKVLSSVTAFNEVKVQTTTSRNVSANKRVKHTATRPRTKRKGSKRAVEIAEEDDEHVCKQKRTRGSEQSVETEDDHDTTIDPPTASTPSAAQIGYAGNSGKTKQLSAVKCSQRGKGDGLGCSIDCGVSDENTLVVSKTIRTYNKLLKDVPVLRKHIADYCFLDDYNLVIKYDILSILPETVMSDNVMECWSMLLNRIEADESVVPRMAFFGLKHMDDVMRMIEQYNQSTPNDRAIDSIVYQWDLFKTQCGTSLNLDADLIFLPIDINGHFACICIDFKAKSVLLLDHQLYGDWENCRMFAASNILANAMSDYLDSKHIEKGGSITEFKHKQLNINGQSCTSNIPESGMMTMMYMLLYEGKPFHHSDLEKRTTRRYLSIELAVSLVVSDLNTTRGDVLDRIDKFASGKETLWDDLKAKRRIAKILEKK